MYPHPFPDFRLTFWLKFLIKRNIVNTAQNVLFFSSLFHGRIRKINLDKAIFKQTGMFWKFFTFREQIDHK